MMGAGKSTVGKIVAEMSGRTFMDTDQMLQRRLGRPVHQLFSVYGEEAFRGHETSMLAGFYPGPTVLATGGGIVLKPENWEHMRRLGTTIFLRANVETLRERLAQSKRRRPLLEAEDWEQRLVNLLESRVSLYEQADVVVDVGDSEHEQVAEKVLAAIREFEAKESSGRPAT
jgi:shikimate kinase